MRVSDTEEASKSLGPVLYRPVYEPPVMAKGVHVTGSIPENILKFRIITSATAFGITYGMAGLIP